MTEYIKREDAIEEVMSEPPDAHYPHWYADKIKAIPAADVMEVNHGHWIEINSDMGIYRCSQCRETVGGQTGSNFCPNCGANMFGVIDEE